MRNLMVALSVSVLAFAGCTEEDFTDTDNDGIADSVDNCRLLANNDQLDGDNDDVGDVCDNCPATANPLQEDANANGTGDACEAVALTEGAINYTWSITENAVASTCADAGLAKASFLATRHPDNEGFDDVFTCADMAGLSAPLGLGFTFTVSPCALDANDACLSAAGVTFESETQEPCDSVDGTGTVCITNAPVVIFDISPQ